MSTQKAKDLRRLLSITKQQRQQQQEAASSSSPKITHPFAKYDTNHKLICVVCSVNIKNESFWNPHLVSLSHKESLRKLKEVKEKSGNISSGTANKVTALINPTSASTFKPKSILKKESSFNILEQESTITSNKKRSVGIEGKIRSTSNVSSSARTDNSVKSLIGYGDEEEENDSEEGEEEKVTEQSRAKRVKYSDNSLTTEYIEPISQTSTIPSDSFNSQLSIDEEDVSTMTSKLPSDFFDIETAASITTANQQISNPIQETEIVQESVLPVDFFDNSSLKHSFTKASTSEIDEQEWINFQKEISKETQVSNQISNADDEELQRDRDEMQEREQEFCLARLERLKNVAKRVKENRDKHMTVDNSNVKTKDDENIDETDDDIDDDFVDGWMDWRAQKIL